MKSNERITFLKEEYLSLKQEYERIAERYDEQNREYCERHNKKCPRCNSPRVVDQIKRVQGSLDGSLSGGFLLGTGSLFGEINGELDTNEVLHCRECNNEWKYEKREYSHQDAAMRDLFYNFYRYFEKKDEAKNVKFNPQDLTEKFQSLEEKRKAIVEEAMQIHQRDSPIRKYHAETLMEFLKKNHYSLPSYMEDILKWDKKRYLEWGCKDFPREDGRLTRLFKKFFR